METYGKYQVIRKIGVGGFGEVYKGFDPVIKRHLAIKTCSAGDESMRQRFFREAEIAGNLHHRNITTVYDFGVEDGVPYLVQEFLTGEDLDRLIERNEPLRAEQKVLYLLQIARGLEYSHEKGVIHRDMKPGNIRILEDGTAKVMDYGIAKLKHQESGLTRTGTTLGTTAYLAPEQVRGVDVDERTDVFSFGVMAYELMTYERPFKGETFSSIMYQILKEEPTPILERSPDCPPQLAALIEKCMAKEPEDRFQSFGEVLAELDGVRGLAEAADASPPAEDAEDPLAGRRIDLAQGAAVLRPPRPPARPRRELVYALALLAAAALGAGAWWLVARPSASAPPAESALAAVRETPGALTGEAATGAAAESAGTPQAPGGGPSDLPDGGAAGGGAAGGGGAGGGVGDDPPPIEALPPPDPEPEPATLLVPRAWSGQVTVSVNGGTPLSLDRQRSWKLPAGRHRLVFDIGVESYRATETVEVEISEGQSRRVESPIGRPGLLTVQAYVGAAQGGVLVDGNDLGRSPISRHTLAPGVHRLQVLPPADGGLEEIAQDITIGSGQELIVTFDLTGERELLVIEREAEGP